MKEEQTEIKSKTRPSFFFKEKQSATPKDEEKEKFVTKRVCPLFGMRSDVDCFDDATKEEQDRSLRCTVHSLLLLPFTQLTSCFPSFIYFFF
jgi:hypothetical protein